MHRSHGATALLGMPGFVVGAQLEVDGEWWLHVETDVDVVGCAACRTRAIGHGRRWVKVRDLPVAGRPVLVVVEADLAMPRPRLRGGHVERAARRHRAAGGADGAGAGGGVPARRRGRGLGGGGGPLARGWV